MSKEKINGWHWPLNSKKAHYFKDDLTSICGKFLCFYAPETEQGNNLSKDNCAACKRKLKKMGIIKSTGITKFKIVVAETEKDGKTLTGREWTEKYDTTNLSSFWELNQEIDLNDAKQIGINMVNFFNRTLRPYEKPRKLVSAHLING